MPDHRLKDETRDARLTQDGFQVLRFWNMDVDRNMDGVIETIWRVLEEGRLNRHPANKDGTDIADFPDNKDDAE